jgi:hypothetical protein
MNFKDPEQVKKNYHLECAELVQKMYLIQILDNDDSTNQLLRTGATRVHIMGHVCRLQSWDAFKAATAEKDDMNRMAIPTTARYVHVGMYLNICG